MTEPTGYTITRTVEAPIADVWRAWTDPDVAATWWHPDGVETPRESVSIDLRVGGGYAYTMRLEGVGEWPTAGTYLEVREPERLRFTWGEPDDPRGDDVPVATVDLRELPGGRTEMTFRMERLPDDRGTDESTHDGWASAFDVLERTLAG